MNELLLIILLIHDLCLVRPCVGTLDLTRESLSSRTQAAFSRTIASELHFL
jgi:hypothetical protein